MQIGGYDIGVCSWSLKLPDIAAMVSAVQGLGLSHVQLALGPLVMLDDKPKHTELGHLRAAGLTLTAGMIAFPGENYATIATIRETGGFLPDAEWPVRKQLTLEAGKLAAELGLKLLSTHIGFVPPSNDPQYQRMIERVREVAKPLGEQGVELLMETGQEGATELLQFLNDLGLRTVGVNFDPANMIMYGAGDPVEAIHTLGRHIRHVHVKDGKLSAQPGVQWGAEVPFGAGQVDVKSFLAALRAARYTGPLVIEREAGDARVRDVATAIQTLRRDADE